MEYLKLRVQGLRLDKINEEFESDFRNKYFKDDSIERNSNSEKDGKNSKEEILKNFLDDKAKEDYKNIHYNPRKIDENSNFYKIKEKENNKDLSPEQIKEKGDKIIKDLGKEYKNVHFNPGPMEGSSIDDEPIRNNNFDDRKPEELYQEGEELPPQQVNGLWEDEEERNQDEERENIIINILENNKIIKYTDSTGKEYQIPLSPIYEEKKDMYKRLEIRKMCKKAIRDTKGRRSFGLRLQRKINPEIVKALDATGNTDLIQHYIESIYTKKELPFELTHNLSGLSMMQKWKMRKYTKSEEKCGAKIIGKMWDKNKSLDSGEKGLKEEIAKGVKEVMEKNEHTDEKEQIAKDELARRKARRQEKENDSKENASFVQKVDGKNKEIAEKYRQESKREIDELLNNLGSEYNDSDKFAMADYINRYGVEAAKERYSKQFTSAEVNISTKEMIDEKHEKELPGNQQIDAGESR